MRGYNSRYVMWLRYLVEPCRYGSHRDHQQTEVEGELGAVQRGHVQEAGRPPPQVDLWRQGGFHLRAIHYSNDIGSFGRKV